MPLVEGRAFKKVGLSTGTAELGEAEGEGARGNVGEEKKELETSGVGSGPIDASKMAIRPWI